MAEKTAVNPEVTDAVTQSNVKVMAEAPAMAMGTLFQSLSHSTGLLYENAVSGQKSTAILEQAATTQGVMQIYQSADALYQAGLVAGESATGKDGA